MVTFILMSCLHFHALISIQQHVYPKQRLPASTSGGDGEGDGDCDGREWRSDT